MFNYLRAALAGAVLAAIGVLLHNTISPIGLLISLAVTGIGVWYVGETLSFRKYKFISALTWIIVLLIAGSSGSGGEVLIIGNLNGDVFLLGGSVLATAVALLKI